MAAHYKDTEKEVYSTLLFSLPVPRWNCWGQIPFCVLWHHTRSPCRSRRSVSIGRGASCAGRVPLVSRGVLRRPWGAGEGPRLHIGSGVSHFFLSSFHAVPCLGSCRGTIKGPAGLRSLRRNGKASIKFHGNHFEGPTSG